MGFCLPLGNPHSNSEVLLSFVNTEILQDTDISPEKFWKGFDAAVHELTPKNKNLIEKREVLQKKIDNWHLENRGKEINTNIYKRFLEDIGYLIKVIMLIEYAGVTIPASMLMRLEEKIKDFLEY